MVKDAKPTPRSSKSAKGPITKKSTGGAAVKKAAKAAKKMKEELNEAIGKDDIVVSELLEGMEGVEFERGELEELIWTFVSSDCSQEEVVMFLVENGLEIHDLSCDGESALVWAVDHAKFGAVEALLKVDADQSNEWDEVFKRALCFKNGSMVSLLLKYGADVNVDSDMEGTALYYAAVKAVCLNDLTCLKLFLEAGAKERLAEVEGRTFTSAWLTPTQYIQRDFGDVSKVYAV